jgi:hypothetical protein
MRQLVFRFATFIVRLLILFTCATSSFYTRTERRGKGLAPRETERERVCVRDGELLKLRLASVLKMAAGRRMNYFESSENQHIKIMVFMGNYFNGEGRTVKIH